MRTRSRNPFTTVRTAGLLLPVDLLTRIADGDSTVPGLEPQSYHLAPDERLNEAASRAWNRLLALWKSFQHTREKLPASDTGTTPTRDRWLLPLFQELGYGRLQPQKAIEFDQTSYPISHGWADHVPIHLISFRHPLDRRTPGVAGAATRSPYSVMQELLNRSAQHRWGFLTNGLKLIILRDNAALARAANVEFDLEAMFDGEVYADFQLLYLVCHQSRVEMPLDGKPEDCWLEKWAALADDQGTRAREKLRDGVENAIKALGAGFLTTRGNATLKQQLSSGDLPTQDYYRQLLRLVYRLLLLLVAEEKKSDDGRNLLHPIDSTPQARQRYEKFYSIGRLRTLASQRRGTAHADQYESQKVLFEKLRTGYMPLAIPALGSFLFSDHSTPDLDAARLSNESLLDTLRQLCFTEDTSARGGAVRRPVDFGNLGSEELGSVYESLLELHPKIDTDAGPFTLGTAAGHERKTTGSYYTPRSLINCLLDSALDPVVTEAIDTPDPQDAEQALLDLKVCDPACGSGHFLIAASERMAKHLARLRTGDDEPSVMDIQHAKRDIIGRCIYGVDLNPMAVELCKVSLWMEALEPGRPLSFLDHHIQCGNSLLGTTPALLSRGIPDAAFKDIAGDDKKFCTSLKNDNKRQRKDIEQGQMGFAFEKPIEAAHLGETMMAINAEPDETLDQIEQKRAHAERLFSSEVWQDARFWADYWCAVFLWKKDGSDLAKHCPTERDFRRVEREGQGTLLPHVREEIKQLRDRYQFFHWHLAFPDVFRIPVGDELPEVESTGWNGGFNVVLGNPPWERFKMQEKEWFAERVPEIVTANTAKRRQELISELAESNPAEFTAFQEAKRRSEGDGHFARQSGAYPLCGRGDVNTYALFAERNLSLVTGNGRLGCILQSGIATDDTTKLFFRDLMRRRAVVSLISFYEIRLFFEDTDSRVPFCLLTLVGRDRSCDQSKFAFGLRRVDAVREPDRIYSLTQHDIEILNPQSMTCPVFDRRQDVELAKVVYRNAARIQDESLGGYYMRLIDLGDHKHELRTEADLGSCQFGQAFEATIGDDVLVRLYEAKLTYAFDHRYGTFEGVGERNQADGKPRDATVSESRMALHCAKPRYWVRKALFRDIVSKYGRQNGWLLAYRDIINTERASLPCAIPFGPATRSLPVLGVDPTVEKWLVLANLASFAFDYCVRQKVAGKHLTFTILKQSPFVPLVTYDNSFDGAFSASLRRFIQPRVIELTYTAWDLEPFAQDCGYDGPPFKWDEDRRFKLRCELDAAYFHLYLGSDEDWQQKGSAELLESFPTPRAAVEYIMDTFPIVRRKDIARTEEKDDKGNVTRAGTYITKDTILQMYGQMAESIKTGQPYATWLTPAPGPPTTDAGNFIPMEDWRGQPAHIHPPREMAVIPAPSREEAKPTKRVRPPAFPEQPRDRWLVARLVEIVEAKSGLTEDYYHDALRLAAHSGACAALLVDDSGAYSQAVKSTGSAFISGSPGQIPWSKVWGHVVRSKAVIGETGSFGPGNEERITRQKSNADAVHADLIPLVVVAADRLAELTPDDPVKKQVRELITV